jgi:hypothetical protein
MCILMNCGKPHRATCIIEQGSILDALAWCPNTTQTEQQLACREEAVQVATRYDTHLLSCLQHSWGLCEQFSNDSAATQSHAAS